MYQLQVPRWVRFNRVAAAMSLWRNARSQGAVLRQVSPVSPAMHLGTHRILVVGVGQPQRSGLVGDIEPATRAPTPGGVAGHAMASGFHDTLQADVEQAQRVTHTLLVALGEHDAYARKEELRSFLPESPVQASLATA